MGNSQKPQDIQNTLQTQIAQNIGHILPEIQVLEPTQTPNEAQVQISVPVPPTPCFKQEAKIQTIPSQILSKIYEEEDKMKQEKEFQILLQKQDKEIQKAKANYERRKQYNSIRLKQLEDQKTRCINVYKQEPDSMDQESNQDEIENSQNMKIIWGQQVCTKIINQKDEYLKHRFPKQQSLETTDYYKNWQIYKQKMYNEQMQEMNEQQERLRNYETELKSKYETLIERKNQRLNSSTTYATLKQKQSKSTKKSMTPSPKKKKKKLKQQPNFLKLSQAPQNRSQQTTKIDFDKSFEKIATLQSPSFLSDLIANSQKANIQHLSAATTETEFLAKQIFYYQNYSSKRRSSFVYSKEEAQKYSSEENQYPSKRKNYERPVRCQQNLRNNSTFRSKSKSPSKKLKFKEDLIEVVKERIVEAMETSVYQKVYEKLPRKEAKMMYSEAEGKLKQVEDFYPYEGSPSQRKNEQVAYPQKIQVTENIGSPPNRDVLEYKIAGKKKSQKQAPAYDFFDALNANSDQKEVELTAYEKQLYRKKKQQRSYEAKVLEKLKMKKLT